MCPFQLREARVEDFFEHEKSTPRNQNERTWRTQGASSRPPVPPAPSISKRVRYDSMSGESGRMMIQSKTTKYAPPIPLPAPVVVRPVSHLRRSAAVPVDHRRAIPETVQCFRFIAEPFRYTQRDRARRSDEVRNT